MKKLFYMITTVAIAASFASCNKIEQDNSTTPVEAPAVDGTTTLTISATSPQTKTYLVDNADKTAKNTNWTKDDLVTLFGLEDKTVTATAKNTTGSAAATLDFVFSGWPAAITPGYLVFDGPLAKQTEGNSVVSPVYNEDGTITATVRSLQVITNKSNMSKYANLSIGKVEENAGAYNTVMKNVCGLIKFELKGDKTSVEDVVIKDALGNPMTGLVKVDYNGGQPEVEEVVERADYVQVKANISGDNNKMLAGVYYACVLPGTYSPEITITHTDGTVTTLKMPENQTITIERSKIFDFTTIYNPTKTLTLTLDCTSWPFDGDPVTSAKTTDEAGDNLTLTQDEVSYTFNVMNTVGGYYHTGSALRGNNKKAGDFRLKLPVIADMKLVEVQVESANAPNANADNRKYIKITGAGEIVSCTINNTDGLTTLVTKEPVIGGQCALESGGNNVQFKTIILKYTN